MEWELLLRYVSPMRSLVFALVLVATSAVTAADFTGNEILIPVVTRVPGAFNSEWRTDLVITNRSETESSPVAVIYEPAGTNPSVEVTFNLAPRATVTVVDAVLELFDKQEGYGTVYLSPHNGAVTISAYARIYNVGSGAGEFGQMMQGLPIDQLSKTTWLNGVIGIRDNRTNIGIANPSSAPATFTLTWYDKNGVEKGTRTNLTVQPWEVQLINNVFSFFGATPDDGMTIKVTSNLPIYAYASVIRNDTGDAFTVIGNGPFNN
jgi:hypothetical protein